MDRIKSLPLDDKGAVTVEFALIMPVLILIFVGSSYLAETTMVQNKVTRAANALARIAAMDSDISDTEFLSYSAAVISLLEPLPGSATTTLTSVGDTGSGVRVRWSDSTGTPLAINATYSFPSGAGAFGTVNTKNTLIAEVSIPHNSVIGRIWNALPWAPFTYAEEHVYKDVAYAVPLTYLGSGTALWTKRTTAAAGTTY